MPPTDNTVQQRLALHFELVPRGGNTDPEAAFLAACSNWLGLGGTQGLEWDEPFSQSLEGGRILRWAPYRGRGGSALADIVVHAPDPLDRSLQWTTHVTYATAEKGRRVVELIVARLAPFLVELSSAELDERFPF